MQLLRRQPIRRQLLAATLVLLLPIVGAVVWSASRSRLERVAEVHDQAASVATTAAAHLDQYFAGLDAMASAVARHPTLLGLEREKVNGFFADLVRNQPILTNLVLTSPDGRVLGAGVPLPSGSEKVSWEFIAEVTRTKRMFVSELATSQISGRPIIIMAYPMRDDRGEVTAVLGLGIDLTHLRTAFEQISLPADSIVTLTDQRGHVLAHTDDADEPTGAGAVADPGEPAQAPLTSDAYERDGIPRIYGSQVVKRGPWLLNVGIPRSVASARVLPLWRRNVAIVGSAAAVLLLLGVFIAWQTALHLTRLRSAAHRIASGDLSPPPRLPAPNLELAELQEAFITMAANLRDTRDALNRQMEQDRKMNETLQSLQRQVVRQERLAAVGVLVSGVAHELNNPLQAILGTAELLERQGGLAPAVLEEISFVKTQSGRAREIIRNLSRFSSQQSGPPSLVDLRDVIAEVVQLRRVDLDTAGITLEVQATSRRRVYANFTELEQVTLNFVINAQQSIEGSSTRGRILVRLFDVGKRVRLEVADNGPGVKPDDEPKLFQPFFTTKPVGKGTGLGLSVSYGIIESYGGAIGHSGNQWGGATFFFELPAGEKGDDASDDRPAVLHGSV